MLIHVRYDEIALKGGKRGWYERHLRRNLAAITGLPMSRIEKPHGRLCIRILEGEDPAPILDGLSRTFGAAGVRDVDALITMKHDADLNVRLAAVRALAKIGGSDAITAVAPALEDEKPAMQYRAVQALRETLGLPDNSRDNLLADCLRRASDWIGAECNRDFYRHPQVTGTEVRTYHLGAAATYIRDDIISLTTVEYPLGTGQAYTVLTAANYTLDPATVDGVPFDALYLSDVGILSSFSAGYATVRLTGVFGYLSVPGLIEQATLDLAREMYQQGPGGRTVGVDFGRLPLSVQRAIAKFRRYIAVFA